MRILLDECVHRGVAKALLPHSVSTVQQAGWRGVKNENLLRLAASQFEVFITTDKNLEYQQHVESLPLPVVTIFTMGSMWMDIEPVIPALIELISGPLSKAFYRVGVADNV